MLPAVAGVLASAHPNYGFYTLAVVHAVAAALAFGGIGFAGVYGAIASRPHRPGAIEDAARWFAKPNRSVYLLPAVPVLGYAALGAEGDSARMGQAWAIAALLIWLVVGALVMYVIRPAEADLRRLLAGAGVGAVDVDAVAVAGRKVSIAAGVCDVAFFVSLCLMIWEPH